MSPELPDLLEPRQRRNPLWFRALCVLGALVFFLLGVVGWLIPVVTGIPFYAVGLVLLGMASDRTRRWINQLERRMPESARRALRRFLRKPTEAPDGGASPE
jgi:hypothetical protein